MANPGVITANKPEKRPQTSHQISRVFSKYGIFLIFAVMIVVASMLSPAFVSSTNLINIVRQMSIVGLIALGVTGIIVSAGIDLSSGSVVGLTAVVAASLAQMPDYSAAFYPGLHLPLIVPVVAACVVGALVGLINGTLVAKARIPPFIATLGTFTAIRGAANLYTGGRPISNLTDDYNFIGQGDVFGVPVPIIILVVMAVVTHILYAHTKFGKYIYAIGGNEQAARVSGINAARYKTLIYVYAVSSGGTGWIGGFVPHWFRATGSWRRLRTGCHRGRGHWWYFPFGGWNRDSGRHDCRCADYRGIEQYP